MTERDEPPIPDERAGQYARIDELGRGGQSVVWRAIDVFVGREVALKELLVRPELAPSTEDTPVRQRFLREARLTAQLDHPGIVAVHELARRPDGTLLCAQKLIRGETLKTRLAACETLADRLALVPHVIDACNAVAYAHSRGIVHRDLKPSNVMVGAFGETVVVDWGLAKKRGESEPEELDLGAAATPELTATGVVLGTPAYMSPEQARGAVSEIGERSDVFNLGAILYEVLTARRPFEGATVDEVIANVLRGELAPVRDVCAEVAPELAAVAERALSHHPEDRYPSALVLAKDLVAYRTGGRVGAYDYGSWELLRKFAARHRALLVALAIGGAIALAALIGSRVLIARQLQRTRLQLASMFLERGYHEEREGDWSKAAASFAAARVQHDTREGQWSFAVARERITERILALQGPPESYVDVTVLADGRVLSLGHSLDRIEIRDAKTGVQLWQRTGEPILAAAFASSDVVAVFHPGGWTFHAATTGRELSSWPSVSGFPCGGQYPIAAAIVDGNLMRLDRGAPAKTVASDVHPDRDFVRGCVVSPDGKLVAYMDITHALRLVSLDDGHELARRQADFLKGLLFSRSHGLVIFRQGSLDVVGAPEGDFTIELPDVGFGKRPFVADPLGGMAVSPDGHLVALTSRLGTTEALVVDLRTRSIRGVLHYAAGAPRFAFSADGNEVFAAGMGNASLLGGWRLPPAEVLSKPRWWGTGRMFPGGAAALAWDDSGRYELRKPPDKPIARGVLPFGGTVLLGDGPLAGFVARDASAVFLHDLQADRQLWRHECQVCRDISVGYDGSVFAFVDATGLEVWDTRANRQLFRESRRIRPFISQSAVSRDGHRVAWSQIDTVVVHDLGSGRESNLPLDGPIRQLQFSPDPERLLAITTRTITLWNTASGRAIWSRGDDEPTGAMSRWSIDRDALIVEHGYNATEVLDVRTGERLAWFEALSRTVTPIEAEVYSNDLRWKGVVGGTMWDFRPVPQPDDTPPEVGLAQTLERTGLELHGVELVAAP